MSDENRLAVDDIPSRIGRYEITGTLGFGAMGAVYKAFDPLIRRPLAIKTIRVDVPRGSPQRRSFKERFYQEARISGTLAHPNIVTLFDMGDENGLLFLAMEYVDGRTVARLLEEGVRFKPEKVVGLISQVAAGLDYAHSRGVVHRDVKPSNLIVYDEDKVKVTDFGIAKLADSEITHTGALLGTPSYMSPEQAMGEKLDGRSDIFSLGVVAFEMLSGVQPFPGANVTSILYKLVHVDPVEPADLEMSGLVPQKWRQVFSRVLAKRPENRYPTATAFVQDLELCLGSWFTGLEGAEGPGAPTGGRDEATVTLPRASPGASDGPTLVLEDERPPLRPPVPETVIVRPVEATDTQPPEPLSASGTPTSTEVETVKAPAPGKPPSGVRPLAWTLGAAALMAAVALLAVRALRPVAPEAAPRPVPAPPALATPEAPPVPAAGTLRVDSEPPGARVRLDGEARGETPLELPEVPFGVHEVRLERRGYRSQKHDVSVTEDAPHAELRVALTRESPPALGMADVISHPPGAAVSVDGRPAGRTPLSDLRLKPGRHRLEVTLEDHETWAGDVDVAAGERGRVEVRLAAVARPTPPPPAPPPVDPTRVYENVAGQVDTLAKKLSGQSPSYPRGAGRLRSGQRVSVLVRFLVTEAGDVRDVSVLESGGEPVDEVVVDAVRGWRFQPATRAGTPVKVHVLFKQTFLGG